MIMKEMYYHEMFSKGLIQTKQKPSREANTGCPVRIKPTPNISSLTLVLTTPDTSVSEKKLRKLSTPECAKYNASGQSATKSQKVESKRIPDVKGNKIK